MITIKTPAEIAVMRKASQIVAEILEALVAAARPGVTTEELDQLAEELTYKKGAKTAFKGYKPGDVVYPKCLCVSINNEIVHGIPSSRKLKAGDIVEPGLRRRVRGLLRRLGAHRRGRPGA